MDDDRPQRARDEREAEGTLTAVATSPYRSRSPSPSRRWRVTYWPGAAPLILVLAVVAAVTMARLVRAPFTWTAMAICTELGADPWRTRRPAEEPPGVLQCYYDDSRVKTLEPLPCDEVRDKLVAATAPELTAERVIRDLADAVVGRGEALETFDACVKGGRGARPVALSVHEATWSGCYALSTLPLFALLWMARARVRVDVDAGERTLAVSRRTWLRMETSVHRLDDVRDVLVDEASASSFGSLRLLITMRTGPRIPFCTRIPLTDGFFSFTRRGHLRAASRLQGALAAAQDAVPEGGA